MGLEVLLLIILGLQNLFFNNIFTKLKYVASLISLSVQKPWWCVQVIAFYLFLVFKIGICIFFFFFVN